MSNIIYIYICAQKYRNKVIIKNRYLCYFLEIYLTIKNTSVHNIYIY